MAVIMGGGPAFMKGHNGNLVLEMERVRRTTQQDFNVIAWRGHVRLDLFFCDEPSTSPPTRRWIIQHVIYFEAV
jgi:hypothetical protein